MTQQEREHAFPADSRILAGPRSALKKDRTRVAERQAYMRTERPNFVVLLQIDVSYTFHSPIALSVRCISLVPFLGFSPLGCSPLCFVILLVAVLPSAPGGRFLASNLGLCFPFLQRVIEHGSPSICPRIRKGLGNKRTIGENQD